MINAENFDNKFIKISISDSGIGIPEKLIKNIFSFDQKNSRKGTKGEPSTGLGLILCKEFVELNEGKIGIESNEGKGTTFYFTVPATESDSFEIVEKIKSSNIITSRKTVLIVDDDETSVNLLTIILKNENFDIVIAVNGAEAINMCTENQNINLVLLDIKMPVLSGCDALKKIKEIRPDLPVIIQTAYADYYNCNEFLENAYSDFILKPINKDTLLQTIRRILRYN